MGDLLNTRQAAQYLGINEKKIYYLAKMGKIPSTRVTGKWTFPKKLIDEWIEGSAGKAIRKVREQTPSLLLAAGSDDPSLGILREIYAQRTAPVSLFWATVGSSAGLTAIRDGIADFALAHLLDPATGQYNLPYLKNQVPEGTAAVRLFRREIGIVVKRGNPLTIRSIADFSRKKIRIINRQPGSGIRFLFDHKLNQLSIDGKQIAGYEKTVTTHMEVGLRILSGEADAGVAARAAARLLGLDFLELTQECFDLLIPKSRFSSPGIQTLVEIVGSKEFRGRVQTMGGYDLSEAGRVLTLGS
jgi:putative molybdopterin biosynthesis protein